MKILGPLVLMIKPKGPEDAPEKLEEE